MAKRQDLAIKTGRLMSFGAKNRLFWGEAAFYLFLICQKMAIKYERV